MMKLLPRHNIYITNTTANSNDLGLFMVSHSEEGPSPSLSSLPSLLLPLPLAATSTTNGNRGIQEASSSLLSQYDVTKLFLHLCRSTVNGKDADTSRHGHREYNNVLPNIFDQCLILPSSADCCTIKQQWLYWDFLHALKAVHIDAPFQHTTTCSIMGALVEGDGRPACITRDLDANYRGDGCGTYPISSMLAIAPPPGLEIDSYAEQKQVMMTASDSLASRVGTAFQIEPLEMDPLLIFGVTLRECRDYVRVSGLKSMHHHSTIAADSK
jgi:hypothetical protein